MKRYNEKAHQKIIQFFKKNNVKYLTNTKLIKIENNVLFLESNDDINDVDIIFEKEEEENITKNDQVLEIDDFIILEKKKINKKLKSEIIINATGTTPNTDFEYFDIDILDDKGFVKVNKYLQMNNHPTWFAIGDIIDLKEEKLAQNAEMHAKVVFNNIVSLDKGKVLESYSVGDRSVIIYLGSKNFIVIKNNQVLDNYVMSSLKNLVDLKSMKNYQ
jgi:NADH dehydrogenase FAD-containing subunit